MLDRNKVLFRIFLEVRPFLRSNIFTNTVNGKMTVSRSSVVCCSQMCFVKWTVVFVSDLHLALHTPASHIAKVCVSDVGSAN